MCAKKDLYIDFQTPIKLFRMHGSAPVVLQYYLAVFEFTMTLISVGGKEFESGNH